MFIYAFEKTAKHLPTRWVDKSDKEVADGAAILDHRSNEWKRIKEFRGINTSAKEDPASYRRALYDYEQKKGMG